MTGKVFLVGAGPGDPELLTLKAVRHLGRADVVLVDSLVDREVLRHTRPDARVIDVGKRGGCRSTPQEFIDRLMIRYARRGLLVVRLKGGDPYVFGRGAEEARCLAEAGIDVEIVSGISAGIAAPAAAGIPVTHRGMASAVTFVTAHTVDEAAPNWGALAQSGSTLVVFMAVARLAQVASALLEHGMPVSTPAALIERATCKDERVRRTTLMGLAELARQGTVASPAILVVGTVAACELARLVPSPATHADEPRSEAA